MSPIYELRARVKTPSAEDHWKSRTGFREIKTKGRLFLLNGERLVMNGVCRHDTWKGQGFTLSRRQQEQDMRMIKAMGCNLCGWCIIRMTAALWSWPTKLDLSSARSLASGTWISTRCHVRSSIWVGKILEQTIQRDWNSPAVCVWLLGNECTFPVSYLKRGKAICDKLDPIHRLVSVAHTYGKFPDVKRYLRRCGFRFR